jgi:hypothetical protein
VKKRLARFIPYGQGFVEFIQVQGYYAKGAEKLSYLGNNFLGKFSTIGKFSDYEAFRSAKMCSPQQSADGCGYNVNLTVIKKPFIGGQTQL